MLRTNILLASLGGSPGTDALETEPVTGEALLRKSVLCESGWRGAPLPCRGLQQKQQRRTCACASTLPAHMPEH